MLLGVSLPQNVSGKNEPAASANFRLAAGSGRLPPTKSALVTVVIVSYQQRPHFAAHPLKALAVQSESRFQGRGDNRQRRQTIGWIAIVCACLTPASRWCARNVNLGFAAGVNLGAALIASALGGQPKPRRLAAKAIGWPSYWLWPRATPQAAAVGSLQLFPCLIPRSSTVPGIVTTPAGPPGAVGTNRAWVFCRRWPRCSRPARPASLYNGAAFRQVGGMYERLFCYMEDVDLGFRLRLAGCICLQANRAKVLHHGDISGGSASGLARRLGFRNRLWVLVRDMPAPLLWVAAPLWLLAQAALLVQAARQGQGPQARQGLVEGMRGAGRGLGRATWGAGLAPGFPGAIGSGHDLVPTGHAATGRLL